MKEKLRQFFSRRQKKRIFDPRRIPSAVLLPLYHKEGQCHLLFIKRTEKVKEHKGQIAFPGGTYEDRDGTLVNTALRESTEEINLKAEDVEILGEMDDELSLTTNYVITPFVSLIPWPYQFKMNEDETEEIIEAPISALLDKDCLHQEIDILDGEAITSYSYHYQDKVIWGATARILNKFLDIYTQVMRDM